MFWLSSDFVTFSNIWPRYSLNFIRFRAEMKRMVLKEFKIFNAVNKEALLIVGNWETRNCAYGPLAAILSREDTVGTVAMDGYRPISFLKRVYKARLRSRNMADKAVKAERTSEFQRPWRCTGTFKTHKNFAEIKRKFVSFKWRYLCLFVRAK